MGAALDRDIALRALTTTTGAVVAWGLARLTGRSRRARTVGLAALVGTQLGQTLAIGGRSPSVVGASVGSMAALVASQDAGGQPVLRVHAAGPDGLVDRGGVGHRRHSARPAAGGTATPLLRRVWLRLASHVPAERLVPSLLDALHHVPGALVPESSGTQFWTSKGGMSNGTQSPGSTAHRVCDFPHLRRQFPRAPSAIAPGGRRCVGWGLLVPTVSPSCRRDGRGRDGKEGIRVDRRDRDSRSTGTLGRSRPRLRPAWECSSSASRYFAPASAALADSVKVSTVRASPRRAAATACAFIACRAGPNLWTMTSISSSRCGGGGRACPLAAPAAINVNSRTRLSMWAFAASSRSVGTSPTLTVNRGSPSVPSSVPWAAHDRRPNRRPCPGGHRRFTVRRRPQLRPDDLAVRDRVDTPPHAGHLTAGRRSSCRWRGSTPSLPVR